MRIILNFIASSLWLWAANEKPFYKRYYRSAEIACIFYNYWILKALRRRKHEGISI